MPYYPTIDEDLARAKAILTEGRVDAELLQQPHVDAESDVYLQIRAHAGGAIYGKDIYAAYKLLESFVEEIERLRSNVNSLTTAERRAQQKLEHRTLTLGAAEQRAAQARQRVCDCGAALTSCASCAVADWQAAHPDCVTCCPRGGSAQELRLDDKGQLDDVVVPNVTMFRLERMDRADWWMRCYMPNHEDLVFRITTSGREIVITAETEKDA